MGQPFNDAIYYSVCALLQTHSHVSTTAIQHMRLYTTFSLWNGRVASRSPASNNAKFGPYRGQKSPCKRSFLRFAYMDLFITMTTNPDWAEIQRELLPGQTSYDRPDLVARVFKLKLQELIDDIYKRKVFGPVSAYVYVVEFQKRGLPHTHILVMLDKNFRLRSPSDIDSCISAQWPDPEKYPLLFDTIKSCMVHGPCGNINPDAPCMKNGICSKGYPKPYQSVTSIAEDGYPLYMRPKDGRTFPIKVHHQTTYDADNQWIVPYNFYLSSKFNCHLNVESVATFRTLKYCFKYIHKGPDRATLQYELDEIKTYIDGRYIGAPEGTWRTFHFAVHEQVPPVVRLQVCLCFACVSEY